MLRNHSGRSNTPAATSPGPALVPAAQPLAAASGEVVARATMASDQLELQPRGKKRVTFDFSAEQLQRGLEQSRRAMAAEPRRGAAVAPLFADGAVFRGWLCLDDIVGARHFRIVARAVLFFEHGLWIARDPARDALPVDVSQGLPEGYKFIARQDSGLLSGTGTLQLPSGAILSGVLRNGVFEHEPTWSFQDVAVQDLPKE